MDKEIITAIVIKAACEMGYAIAVFLARQFDFSGGFLLCLLYGLSFFFLPFAFILGIAYALKLQAPYNIRRIFNRA